MKLVFFFAETILFRSYILTHYIEVPCWRLRCVLVHPGKVSVGVCQICKFLERCLKLFSQNSHDHGCCEYIQNIGQNDGRQHARYSVTLYRARSDLIPRLRLAALFPGGYLHAIEYGFQISLSAYWPRFPQKKEAHTHRSLAGGARGHG